MIDIDIIRKNPEIVRQNIQKRGELEKLLWVDQIKEKDEHWRQLKAEVDALRAERNTLSQQINEAKKAGKDIKKIIEKAKKIPEEIAEKEKQLVVIKEEIDSFLLSIPNTLDPGVPLGKSADDNPTIRKAGKLPKFKFELKNHVELCESLNIADFERSAKITGRGFYFLKNELVILEQALIRYALDTLRKKGFTVMTVPLMLRREAYQGVTDLSAFKDVMYKIEETDNYLIATSEHPLVSQFMNEILEEKDLPIKVAGLSACFRKEAGAHGVDEKGLFRVHQFNKIEQVVIAKPEDSAKIHEQLLKNAEEIFKGLGLPYRVILLCSADTGKVMAKTYDIEVWMPRTKQYREAVSCSNATDYQARRLAIRYRTPEGTMLVHTLNSTAIATSRAIVAILENYQQKDGSVKIPKVLWKYMGGIKAIKKQK